MSFLESIYNALKIPELKRKIIFTLLIFAVFRIVAFVPIPGVEPGAVRELFRSNQFFGLLNLVSGGAMENFSIIALGLNPYINASIILQLLTMVFPKLEELSKEGEYGREKINQYTRFLTVPLAALQAYGMYFLLNRQGVLGSLSPLALSVLIVTLSAGVMFLVWLGEQLSEYGIGNGISMLIFAGIVSRLPLTFGQTLTITTKETFFSLFGLIFLGVVTVYAIVKVNEGARRIPVQYAKRVRGIRTYGGQTTHLPLRVNQAGVIPIIFAVSLVLIPSMIGQFLQGSTNPQAGEIARRLVSLFSASSPVYNVTYFLLVIAFTYFYTAVTFNPDKIADEIKKYGGFIPGIRPGRPTANYLSYILTRITLAGAIFLGLIAVFPSITQSITDVSTLTIGGTGILIVVSVVMETLKQAEAMLATRDYEGFL